MGCPVCGSVGAGRLHVALHQYSERVRRGIYSVTRPEYGSGARFFLGEKECAVMAGWAVEAGIARFKDKRLMILG